LDRNSFVKLVEEKYGAEAPRIIEALEWAEELHAGQKRHTGEPYITHPIAIAERLVSIDIGDNTVVSALLHDVIEDCGVTKEEIEERFGPSVSFVVEGLSYLKELSDEVKQSQEDFESARKLILASIQDVRVLIIKLADRLHNMKTIEGLRKISEDKPKKYAKDTLDLFVPLAEYIGMGQWKSELEDLSFRYLHYNESNEIVRILEKTKNRSQKSVDEVINKINELLTVNDVEHKVVGRRKGIYSIYKKISKYTKEGKKIGEDLEGIYDKYAFRILVDESVDCYKVLGLLYSKWIPLTELDDYIARPKPNGYRSLQIDMDVDGIPAELQIRTHDMHEYNEYGPASHVAYKLSGDRNVAATDKYSWVKKLVSWKDMGPSKRYQLNLFKDSIFVFTPENQVIELPIGATPIDFAYRIHTELGNRCRGAVVNGKKVSLDSELKNADKIEVTVDKNARFPSPGWIDFVVTDGAKTKIRQALRIQKSEEFEAIGKARLMEYMRTVGLESFEELDKERVTDFIMNRQLPDIEKLYAKVGEGEITAKSFIDYVNPNKEEIIRTRYITSSKGIILDGVDGIAYRTAKCCNPLHGDKVKGYVTVGKGISIHRKDCSKLVGLDEKRLLPAYWPDQISYQDVNLEVRAFNRIGMISDIAKVLTERVNIADFDVNKQNGSIVANLLVQTKNRERSQPCCKQTPPHGRD